VRTLLELAARPDLDDVHIRVDSERLERAMKTPDEILFQVPLLALTLLVIARATKGELLTADMTTWACATLAWHFRGIRDARKRMDWSLALRRRCADALVFLENRGLVSVRETPERRITASADGFAFLRKALKETTELGTLVRALDRAHRAAEQAGLDLP
jgi:hypothetical protein